MKFLFPLLFFSVIGTIIYGIFYVPKNSSEFDTELPYSVENKILGTVIEVSECLHTWASFRCDLKTDSGNKLTLDLLKFENDMINTNDVLTLQILHYEEFTRIRYFKNDSPSWRRTCKIGMNDCIDIYNQFEGSTEIVSLDSFDHNVVIDPALNPKF